MKGILSIIERRRVSILSAAFLAVIFLQAQAAPAAAADNYSAAEKIYLKTVTPILYEYSQVASQVSANVLPLQSAPLERCSGEFAHYYGIMSSLGKQLGTITPPARFESVQANSASAISEYKTSLNLYSAACTQEDFGTKGELVSRAGAGVNRSVATIGRVYKEIEDLGAVAAAPSAADGAVSENLSESAIETAPSGEAVEDVYVEEQAVEAAPPPAPTTPPAPKTREEVIQNLAEEVDTGGAPEAAEVQKTSPAAPVAEAPKPAAPPVVKAPEPVKPAPAAPAEAPAKTAKIEPSEETLPLPPPPVEPAPVETKKLPEPEKPEAVQAKPEPEPAPEKPAPAPEPVVEPAAPKVEQAPVKETASVPAPAAAVPAPAAPEKPAPAPAAPPNEPAPAPEPTLTPSPQEGAAIAEVGPQPLQPGDAASETVTEKSMDTAALAPEDELKEEVLPEDEINSWCSRYQTDFEREACVKKRTEARDKAEALSTSFEDGTPEKEIVEKCRADWKEGITYNYEMVVSCTQFFCGQKGLEACKELSK
jgi:hypothetical protein